MQQEEKQDEAGMEKGRRPSASHWERKQLSEGMRPDVQSEANTMEKAKVLPKLGKDRQNEEGA